MQSNQDGNIVFVTLEERETILIHIDDRTEHCLRLRLEKGKLNIRGPMTKNVREFEYTKDGFTEIEQKDPG